MKRNVLKVGLTTILVFTAPVVFAMGDAAAGMGKSSTCVGCHGTAGISNNNLWPNLAGQKEGYLAKAIKDYRDGNRSDPMMSSMAKPLSDQDVADLAAYFSSLK